MSQGNGPAQVLGGRLQLPSLCLLTSLGNWRAAEDFQPLQLRGSGVLSARPRVLTETNSTQDVSPNHRHAPDPQQAF